MRVPSISFHTILIGAASALALVALVALFANADEADEVETAQDDAVETPAEPAGELALGDPDAPVTIIEYASLSCPHCAQFHAERLPWLKENYIDTGKARLVFRDFPLNGPALWGAQVAHCSTPDRYFAFLDLLFKKQETWAFAEDPQAELAKLAKMGGIGRAQFDACIADEALQERIIQSRMTAQEEWDVSSTPSFVINGELMPGIPTEEKLTEVIEAATP